MRILFLNSLLLLLTVFIAKTEAANYEIPPEIRFTCSRENSASEIVYYFNKPSISPDNYPILILCDGSSNEENLTSVMFLHQYFETQIAALGVGIITVEKWGIDGNEIDESAFWSHYSRSQRLEDHLRIIRCLEDYPPDGWNGELLFIGISEGGPLVTCLSIACHQTLAAVNWVGACHESWIDEFWIYFEHMKQKYNLKKIDSLPPTREEYDALVEHIKQNPSTEEKLCGMSYFYLADAFKTQSIDYAQLHSPYLVVMGTEDPFIYACDEFVNKATALGAPITYWRVDGMDHWIRRRPDIIYATFEWLQTQLEVVKVSQN